LSEEEIAEGYILACQSRLKSDIEVEMDESAAITSSPVAGRIVKREFFGGQARSIHLKSPISA
ncbi:MAG TPA: hypothetical protein VGE55_14065, partial [Limnobacter sp.]|uniref:2Fe-2S iron-sulfur cluster-binding protein n=1 Tax=Limnobacter sp. TaxID=2003368 RepID=UPI002F0F3F83